MTIVAFVFVSNNFPAVLIRQEGHTRALACACATEGTLLIYKRGHNAALDLGLMIASTTSLYLEGGRADALLKSPLFAQLWFDFGTVQAAHQSTAFGALL